jgi:hypothetical protein
MKRIILFLLAVVTASGCLFAQATKNPFSKLGYKKQIMYTSSKGEFDEFHNNADVVEIGSVYFNTKTNKIVGFISEEREKTEVASATSAMSVDPLCEKYYWISPYAYCLNNPVKFIDPDGRDVEIVIGKSYAKNGEEHPYGHAAIRVYGKGYNYVFDFGRYGKTWGLGNMKGEGILNVYTNGTKYMNDEQSFRDSRGFNISTTSEEDQKVIDYYLNLAKEGEVYKTGAVPGGGGEAYKLSENYDAFSNNCVTKSAEGLEQIGENKIGDEYKPLNVLENFESNYKILGFNKVTTYLKGGGTKVTYQRQDDQNNQKKEEENK